MTNEASDGAGVPAALPQDAVAFGQLILMAYKMSGQGINPPLPPDFPTHYQIVKNVIMDDYGTPTFYGFIAHLKQPNTNNYVLVIRGTLGIVEWLIDLQSMVSVPFYTYGNVGSGFADTYKTIYLWPPPPMPVRPGAATASLGASAAKRPFAEQVAGALRTHAATAEMGTAALPAPRLALAGHSLGSALVTLYAVERLVYPSMPIDKFYTFASPLVGDPAFGAAFDGLHLSVTKRIFDNWDPVAALPPLSGYAPVGAAQEIKLNTSYYGWDPLCSHSMDTYLNYFDPSHPPADACTTLIPRAATKMAVAAPAAAALTRATSIKQGSTTITITIQTSGG